MDNSKGSGTSNRCNQRVCRFFLHDVKINTILLLPLTEAKSKSEGQSHIFAKSLFEAESAAFKGHHSEVDIHTLKEDFLQTSLLLVKIGQFTIHMAG